MKKRNRYLFKNTFIFALSSLSTKLITFFLIPLYTWRLTTAEYGTVDLLFTICNFVYPLLTLNIVEAVFRFSMDKNADHKKIINLGIICYCICLIFGLPSVIILKSFSDYNNVAWLFYFHLILLSSAQIMLAFLKGQEKLKLFALGNIINTALVAAFSVLFLCVFNFSVKGYFLAYIIANIITSLYCIILGKIKLNFKKEYFDAELYKKMIKYSVVLMPTIFLWWIVNSSDKLMITILISSTANGIYAISYKIPSLLTMIGTIFNQAWMFSAINEVNSSDYKEYTNNIFQNLSMILMTSSVFVLIIVKYLFRFYVSAQFYSAWKYVPYLVIGYIFMTLSTFISTSYNVHKDSKGFLFSALVGALSNILLNFILIPFVGIHGAAIATMISYIIIFLYRFFDTKKYVEIRITVEQCISLILCIAVAALTYLNSYLATIAQSLILITLVILFKKRIILCVKSLLKAVKK